MTMNRPLYVLIVDDEDSFRMSLEIALKMSNRHVVESCMSGEDAIEKLKKSEFDVILIDYKMEGLSGLDVLKWMHENSVDTPAIMLTGAGSEEIAVDAMKLGAYDYLTKDRVEIDRLSLTIKSVHERHQYRKEMFRRQMGEQRDQVRQKELSALQMFQNTVNSVGQFVNGGLSTLAKSVLDREEELLKYVNPQGREQVQKMLADIRQDLEVISAGVKSMLDLSTLVGQKLEGIQNSEKTEEKAT